MELKEFKKWGDEKYCIEKVKKNGYALRYVKNQTDEICIEAVKQNGDALRYVKKQNDEICLEAVKENGYALNYVNDKKLFIKLKMMEKINGSN